MSHGHLVSLWGMLAGVDQHRRGRSDEHPRPGYGFGVAAPTASRSAAHRPKRVYRHRGDDTNTHGTQPGIDGYMAGCRCHRCCKAQQAREHQISAHFARRHHT